MFLFSIKKFLQKKPEKYLSFSCEQEIEIAGLMYFSENWNAVEFWHRQKIDRRFKAKNHCYFSCTPQNTALH